MREEEMFLNNFFGAEIFFRKKEDLNTEKE